MTVIGVDRTHPVLACAEAIDRALKAAAVVDPGFMTVPDKKTALLELGRLVTRVTELQLRVLAASDDVADDEGMRDPAAWLAHHAHLDRGDARRRQRTARALTAHPAVAAALHTGAADPAHAAAVLDAVAALPDHVPTHVRAEAEAHLVAQAGSFCPTDLKILGRRVLHVVAPEIADEQERKALEDEEAHAARTQTLRLRANGDGTTEIHARVPDHAANRLRTYLEAFTSPRQPGNTGDPEASAPAADCTAARRPYAQQLGDAFVAFLEHTDPTRLPLHGGDATTVIITMDHQTLLDDLTHHTTAGHTGRVWAQPGPTRPAGAGTGTGVAHQGDQPVSPSHARRLACTAGIIPAVLDTDSTVLDLGRTTRLYRPHQRKAMALQDPTCRAAGCDIPAPWCEAHHLTPWTHGGRTDTTDGALLCTHHHHRIHDPAYTTTHQPDGLHFHRRT